MLVMACLTILSAQADITVKVQKGGTAPFLYAWDASDNELTGEWPGTQFTEKDADGYWTTTIATSLTQINMIMNMGSSGPQTGNFLNIAGVDGTIKMLYDGNTTMFGTMPGVAYQAGKVAYFACPTTWDGNIYCKIKNNGYEEAHQMTKIGTDGMGLDVYADYNFTGWNDTPQQVQFYDMSNHYVEYMSYTQGGYYNGFTTYPVASFCALSATNGFTDANFRAGIARQLGINDGDAFTPSMVTKLDVSNRGITSLAGINQFAMLIDLNASSNSINSTTSFSGNTNLEILNLADNGTFTGVTSGHTPYADIAACKELKYLDMSGNKFYYSASLANNTNLETLKLNNNPTYDYWSSSVTSALSKLKHVELSGCKITSGLTLPASVTYLDVSNNPTSLTSLNLTGKTNLETLILNGNTGLQSATATSGGKLVGLNTLAKLKHVEFTDVDLGTNNLITNLEASKGTLEYLDLSRATLVSPSLSGFTALKTFKAAGNYNLTSGGSRYSLTSLTINDSPLLSSIDVTGDQALKTLNLTNIGRNNSNIDGLFTGLTDCTALEMMNFDGNGFTSVPAFGHDTYTSLKLNKNALTSIDMSQADPGVRFLYAEQNGLGGDVQLTATSAGPLKGLDLGNNGITSFKAEGTALSALMVGDNPTMTTLELHGNNNLTCTTAGTTMSDGSGLYLLGNTALETIDLSNSSFTQIGADAALQGLTAVHTLNGSHNQFTTFTNSNYDNGERLASYVAGKASLEHLTGLKHLDLSHNALADSVHLYRNTLLEYLDVSHNNVIGPLATTDAEKTAMRLRKANLLRKYHCKDTPVGISCPAATQATLDANEAVTHRAFDLRDIDLRDTTGLFHLDLNYNVELKYLDISETNIHNTAAGWWYMNPGWEYGTGGWYSTTTTSMTKSPAYGSTRHHFVWLQTCSKLEEFHADNNNMQSLGVRTSPYLHTITAKGMYGDCWLMRDAGTTSNPNNLTNRGNISISGTVVTYSRTSYTTNTDGTLSGTVYYKDASGVEGGTNYYPNPVKWYDVSNSGYYAVRTANGKDLEHLDVSGNHLSELKVSGNTKLQYVDTENNDLLTYVDANDLPDLATLKVADNPVLEKLYADNDPSLPGIDGLDDCAALKYLHVQNDGLLGTNGFNVEANTSLQSLLASQCNLAGEFKVSQCASLDTLSVYDNQIRTLNVAPLQNMHWLDCYNNQISILVPGASTGMTHLDLHNNAVMDLELTANTAMQYFDCDNNHIRELNLAGAADINTIHANDNNLFQLNLTGAHSLLADLQFENNHINGIDLSGCISDVLTNIQDENNGRTITANGGVVNGSRMYFFQLEDKPYSGKYINNEYCTEDGGTYGRHSQQGTTTGEKTLATDGFDMSRVTWSETPFKGNRSRAQDYGLDPDLVMGTVVVLENTSTDPALASGQEVYTYDNGISQSTFYLNWTADAELITDVEDLQQGEIAVEGGDGCITVTAPQAMEIIVTDAAGRIVAQRTIEAGNTVFDSLATGIYIVAGQKVLVK